MKEYYRGVVNITTKATWLQHFLTNLGVHFHCPIVIWCDDQSTLNLCKDQVQWKQTKYIKVHMHFIRGKIQDGFIDMQFCPSS